MKQIISDIINFVKKRRAATAFLVILVLSLGIFVFKNFPKAKQPEYQTTQVEKGTLIISVTASGQVSEANSATVGTKASGVVKQIYVTNGQKVQAGDKIAEIDLDLEGQQRATSAWASYQSTKDSLYSLQSDMLSKWKTFKDLAESGTYQNADNTPRYDMRTLSQYVTVEDDWLATEAKYKNQQNLINNCLCSNLRNGYWVSFTSWYCFNCSIKYFWNLNCSKNCQYPNRCFADYSSRFDTNRYAKSKNRQQSYAYL